MEKEGLNIMVINVDPLAFTVPTKIDETRFMVNVFHKDYEADVYGILIINTYPSLNFVFFKNDMYGEADEKITHAMNMMKQYIVQTLKINGDSVNSIHGAYQFGSDMELQMGLDIQKNGPDGKPELDNDGKPIIKHVDIKQKLN